MTSATPSGLAALRVRGVGLTRRGWWFLVAGAVLIVLAYTGGRSLLLYAGFLLVALPLVALVLVAARRPRLAATRHFAPGVVSVGETAAVAVTVQNLAPSRSLAAGWRDGLPWRPFVTPPGRLVALEGRSPRFGGRSRTTVGYDVVAPRRGVIMLGPLDVEVSDPFDLAIAAVTVGGAQPLIVTPAVVPLSTGTLSAPGGDGEATVLQRRTTGDDDDAMTREYRTGDALRRVHWRATARHGDLMVRQEEQRSLPRARLVIDTLRDGYPDATPDERARVMDGDGESAAFEWAVRMLASAAVHLRRLGYTIEIEETGTAQLDGVGRRRTWGDEELLVRLASLGLEEDAVRSARAPVATSGPVIAVAGHPTSPTVQWLSGRRQTGQLAVVFLVQSLSPLGRLDPLLDRRPGVTPASEVLTDAGWLVVPVRSDDDPAAAWQAITVETGRARGTA
jgi:uncharacterized protein (DUF58 family)